MKISPDYVIMRLEEGNDYDDAMNGWLRGGRVRSVTTDSRTGVFLWYDDEADDRTKPVQKFEVHVTEVPL